MKCAGFLLVVVALIQGGEADPTSRGGVEKAPTFPAWDKAECQTQAWLRNLSKHQRRYACWEHILGEAVEEVTPHRNQLGYKDENPPVPCLTKRGRQLCRTLCGRQLLELVQDQKPKYSHPWVASCVRTHLVNRCGPEGIHCWLPEGRARIQAKLGNQADSLTDANLRTLLLPRCNFSGQLELDEVEGIKPRRGDILPNDVQQDPFRTPFSRGPLEERFSQDEARTRRLEYIQQEGFPSPANLRGEDDSLGNLYGTLRLPVNFKKWRQWPSMLGSHGAVVETGSESPRDPRGTRLQLKFMKEILRPLPNEGMDLRWAKYGYALGMDHVQGNLELQDTEWDFGEILARSHNLYRLAPKGTGPFGIWGYARKPLLQPGEDGAEVFLQSVVQQPEDYLRVGVCFDTPLAAQRLRGNPDWLKR